MKKDTPESPPEAPLTIFQAMNAIMTDLGPISKSKVNTEQNYKFRGIDAAMDALNPLLAKHWVFPTTEDIENILYETVVSKNGKVWYHIIRRYTFLLNAKDWSNIKTKADWEAIDYGDKAAGKAYSVAYRDMLYKTFVAPFEQSTIAPQGSMDIEDENHDIYDKSKDQTITQTPAKAATPAKTQTPAKKDAPVRLCTKYWIDKNKQVWEDYWVIKMGVRGHEKNEDGTPKNTMENMWSTFDAEIQMIFWKAKIEELTINESIKLEDINRRKLADIIAEESRLRVEQTPWHTSGSTKVVHNQSESVWKTPWRTRA